MRPAYLADKSALVRMPNAAVRARLEPLLVDGLVATCGIIDLEIGFSARTAPVHRDIRRERRSLPRARIDDDVLDRAFEVQGLLADRGQHRLAIPDLIIAAAAESAGLTVLHYDADFERIAEVTDQEQDWVVPRGSV
ncbi:MAG: PIN domain nuclease [Nitriliruptoraceae bacterium]